VYQNIKISEITEQIKTRKINERGVKVIKDRIKERGYNHSHPVVVCKNGGGYCLIDGNHRVAAVKELGHTVISAFVVQLETELERFRRAILDNKDTETIIPTTFVDNAELIWKLSEKYTQLEIGVILGLSRERVRDYKQLRKIDVEVWTIIGASFADIAPTAGKGIAPLFGANAPFNEGLLRNILPLTPPQQLELVSNLADNTINKKQFQKMAHKYHTRNTIKKHVSEKLERCGEEYITKAHAEIDNGNYDTDWETGKKRLSRMIDKMIEEWEEKEGIILIHGDFETEILDIENGSVDFVLTDPPYNLGNYCGITKKGGELSPSCFGEWDEELPEQFLENVSFWLSHFYRVLKMGGALVIFCDKILISDIWRMSKEHGFAPKNIIVWKKDNPHPAGLARRNLKSSVEFMLWAVKGTNYTFNKSSSWDLSNVIQTTLCGGRERIKDTKGDTLHPTQKPEAVILPLIEVFSNYGDIVLDGFAGTGTTGACCKKLGRKFTGIEQNKLFYDSMVKRVGDT
jgi:DNA modification methylase/ParB-like chromosome segregation protein Spo0J